MLKPLKTTLSLLLVVNIVNAADPVPATEPAPAEKSTESDRLDIKVLEDKYWSAKDDDFSVIQNRAFTKEKRYFGSLTGGIVINDSFTTGQVITGSGGYFFSERWGLELSYMQGQIVDNDTTKQVVKLDGSPDYNKVKNAITLSGMYFPLYAKMSLLDKKILYFDMGVSLGLGITTYESQITSLPNKTASTMHYSLDITQNIFFSQHWALRFDIKNRWSKQDIYKNHAPISATTGNKLPSLQIHDTNFVLGFTYFH